MINDIILLLTPFEDLSKNRVAKHLGYFQLAVPFDECFYQPLQKVFPKVILYDYLKRMIEVSAGGTNKEVIDLVREERPKYVLWLAFGEYYEIQESTFDAIRAEGTKVIGWFFDDEVRFDYYSKWWVPHLDYFVTNDPGAVLKYRELGARAMFAITDTWSRVERDWSNVNEQYEVTFVGSLRADRKRYLQAVKDSEIPIQLFGSSWGNFISYGEMMEIFGTSKINLNFSKTYKFGKLGIKGRIFKVCLAGGFLLTEYVPGIEKYFEIDKEIVCFRDKEEMIDKIIYYLNHDKERQTIARAGWERASAEYTSLHIISKMFDEIDRYGTLDEKSQPKMSAMPTSIKERISDFYKAWGIAYLAENQKGLWRDALPLALTYNPGSRRLRFLCAFGNLPLVVRFVPIKVYIIAIKVRRHLFILGGHVPFARKVYYALKTKTSSEEPENG